MTPDSTAVTATAVQEIAALAQEAQQVQRLEAGEYEYTNRPLIRIDTDPQVPVPLEFYTLGAFAAYLEAEDETRNPLVHVVSPRQVDAVSKLIGEDNHLRRVPARAVLKSAIQGFMFGQQMPLEMLNIALQTCFQPTIGQIEELRRFCASVRSSQSVGVDDDGVSQTVEAKSGIAAVRTTPVNNPWHLAPWRTFAEVAQPVSPFILRFKQGEEPQAGLYETGDGSWQVDAVKAIAAYLSDRLGPDWTVLG
jgi:hypothetical protein